MKLRAFAAAWTVFTALVAPAMLVAQEAAPEQAPAEQPAADPAPAEEAKPEQKPKPKEEAEAPAPAEDPAPAAQPAPAPQPAQASDPEPQPEPAAPAAPTADQEPAGRKPVARTAADASVTIKDFAFSPSSVTIGVGDTVTWTNQDSTQHTATGDNFDTGLLDKGRSGSHTFDSAGTFSYICTPHPYMKAKVTVTGESDSGSDGDSGSDSTAGQEDLGSSAPSGDSADTSDGDELPNSGLDAWALALLGTGFLSLGVAVRRRAA